MRSNNRQALIVFSREPVAGTTKTRMMPYYTGEQCRMLHTCFLSDISEECRKVDADVFVYYTREGMSGDAPEVECPIIYECFGEKAIYRMQSGENLFIRMSNALSEVLGQGYDAAVLIGSDIPEIKHTTFETAFDLLTRYDTVLGPSADNGYYLIGMSRYSNAPFHIDRNLENVVAATAAAIEEAGLTYHFVDEYQDMDTRDDIADYRDRMRKSRVLRNKKTGRFIRDNTTISIVVPVYNEEKTIEDMQLQLREYVDDAEIIFVDGRSTDRTLELMLPGVKVIKSVTGRGQQLNAGALASTGDIIFFLHCDSRLPRNITTQIRMSMAEHEYGCFGLKYDSRNFFMLTNRLISNHRAKHRGIVFGDQGIFIDRRLFIRMGMFPEYPLMEDYEFSLRLRRQGYIPSMTRSRLLASDRRYGKSTLHILHTEFRMWNLRRRYRKGVDPEVLNSEYKNIR